MPGRGDLPRGCAPGEVGAVREDQLRLRPGRRRDQQAHRRVRHRAQRPESAAGVKRGHRAASGRREEVVAGYPAAVTPETLDHVALWVADRDPIADFLTSRVGMHVVDRTDAFTLVGSDARRGKLTLFAAEGPREPGALKHVALRVSSLDEALEDLDGTEVERPREGEAYFDV